MPLSMQVLISPMKISTLKGKHVIQVIHKRKKKKNSVRSFGCDLFKSRETNYAHALSTSKKNP